MKVLQIVLFYPPAWGYGGPPRVMFSLGKALTLAGHEVTVYTSDVLDDRTRVSERERVLDGVRVVAFRNLYGFLSQIIPYQGPCPRTAVTGTTRLSIAR